MTWKKRMEEWLTNYGKGKLIVSERIKEKSIGFSHS
jgi:hypothetical protein